MDLHIRNYILYKARTLEERKKELANLKTQYEEMRKDIIDESPTPPDGMPRGKGATSDPTSSKVVRLEKVSKRIKVLEKELTAFKKAEDTFALLGSESVRIYKETIKGQINLEYAAMEFGLSPRALYNYRCKLMEIIAKELDEYIDLDELE